MEFKSHISMHNSNKTPYFIVEHFNIEIYLCVLIIKKSTWLKDIQQLVVFKSL